MTSVKTGLSLGSEPSSLPIFLGLEVFFLTRQPALVSDIRGVDGERESDLKTYQVVCVVGREVPHTFQVFLLEKKGAKPRVLLSSKVGQGKPAGKITAPNQPAASIASQPIPRLE